MHENLWDMMFGEEKTLELKKNSLESLTVEIDLVDHVVKANLRKKKATLKIGFGIPDEADKLREFSLWKELVSKNTEGDKDEEQ